MFQTPPLLPIGRPALCLSASTTIDALRDQLLSLSLLFLSLSPTARPVVFLRGPFLLALFFSPSLFACLFHCHFFLISELCWQLGLPWSGLFLFTQSDRLIVLFGPNSPRLCGSRPHCASSLCCVPLARRDHRAALRLSWSHRLCCCGLLPAHSCDPATVRTPLATRPAQPAASHTAVSDRCTARHSPPASLAHPHHGRSWCRHASRLCIALLHTAKSRQTIRR